MSEPSLTESLWDRKRLATMKSVQAVALDLFDRDGYSGTTIERIAASAEVSPSSVYRHFGTKEQLALWDDRDAAGFTEVVDDLRGLSSIDATRHTVRTLLTGMFLRDDELVRRRIGYMMREPAIEAASALRFHQAAEDFGTALSEGLGRPHGDLEVQLFAHAVLGAIVGAIHHWYESDFSTPLDDILERVLSSFERGFALWD